MKVRAIGIDLKLEKDKSDTGICPTARKIHERKDEFYSQLQASIDEVKYKETIIVYGDWNGYVGADRRHHEEIIGGFSIENRNEDEQGIIDFSVVNDLIIVNTLYYHRPSLKWMWYRWNSRDLIQNEKSMIDLFLADNKTLFRDVKAIPSVSMDTDYRMVLAKVGVRVPKRKKGTERKRFKIVKLGDPEYADRHRLRLEEKLPNIVEDQDIEA